MTRWVPKAMASCNCNLAGLPSSLPRLSFRHRFDGPAEFSTARAQTAVARRAESDLDPSSVSQGGVRDSSALFERDFAKRQFDLGKPTGSDAEPVDSEPDQDSRYVGVACHLAAHAHC